MIRNTMAFWDGLSCCKLVFSFNFVRFKINTNKLFGMTDLKFEMRGKPHEWNQIQTRNAKGQPECKSFCWYLKLKLMSWLRLFQQLICHFKWTLQIYLSHKVTHARAHLLSKTRVKWLHFFRLTWPLKVEESFSLSLF